MVTALWIRSVSVQKKKIRTKRFYIETAYVLKPQIVK